MFHRSLLASLLLLPCCTYAQIPRLWGLATSGGANSEGTIFRVDADGTDFVKVFDFDETSGWGPEGGLCLAPNGKLYGTTAHGGLGSPIGGTLFSFDPGGAGFHKILDFDIFNGGGNWGSLVMAGDGLLYGGQYMGGAGGGSIYSLDPATDTYTIVHGLDVTTDGSGITDKLMLGGDGWLYGTAEYGGASNVGTIFRFDPITHTFENLHDFTDGEGGSTPYGGLCASAGGWLYGITFTGGLNMFGIVYKYDPVSDQFVTLADLDTIPGSNCWSGMVNAGPDLLIGTVPVGGNYGSGFIYGVIPSTDAFTEVFSFTPVNGGNQLGNELVASDGMVYGLCQAGGTSGLGTVYKFDPITHAMTVLHSFDLTNDGGASRGDLAEAGTATGIGEEEETAALCVSPNPTTGTVTVMCAALSSGTTYSITDALGREVKNGSIGGATAVLDLPVAPGTYTLAITSAGMRRMVRIVKQ